MLMFWLITCIFPVITYMNEDLETTRMPSTGFNLRFFYPSVGDLYHQVESHRTRVSKSEPRSGVGKVMFIDSPSSIFVQLLML